MVEFSLWDIVSNLLLAARWTLVLSMIAFVGGGNMAGALVGGLLRSGWAPQTITVVEPDAAQRQRLGGRHTVQRVVEHQVQAQAEVVARLLLQDLRVDGLRAVRRGEVVEERAHDGLQLHDERGRVGGGRVRPDGCAVDERPALRRPCRGAGEGRRPGRMTSVESPGDRCGPLSLADLRWHAPHGAIERQRARLSEPLNRGPRPPP